MGKFLKYINESYVTLITGKDWAHEIYVNPSVKEIKSSRYLNSIRYIIDFKNKNLFIWNANILHYMVLPLLKQEKLISREGFSHFTMGSANVLSNGKLKLRNSDLGNALKGRHFEWMDSDDTWLNKWFDEPFIKSYIESVNER